MTTLMDISSEEISRPSACRDNIPLESSSGEVIAVESVGLFLHLLLAELTLGSQPRKSSRLSASEPVFRQRSSTTLNAAARTDQRVADSTLRIDY